MTVLFRKALCQQMTILSVPIHDTPHPCKGEAEPADRKCHGELGAKASVHRPVVISDA